MDVELLKNWKDGQTKIIQDQTITKLDDDGDGSTRTNIMYTPPTHNIFIHPTFLSIPISVEQAGTIYILVDRESEEAVNAKNYTIQIYDRSGRVELYAVTPKDNPGKEFKYGVWYNHFGIEVPAFAGAEFNVVVTDNTTGQAVNYLVQTNVEESTIEMETRFASKQ